MGFEPNYTEIIKRVEDLVQIIFEKLSRHCRYCEPTLIRKDMVSSVPNTCLYYGRNRSQRCGKESCPLLEEEAQNA